MFHVHWSITLHEATESIIISITTPPTSSATCPFSSCDRLKTYSGLSSIGYSSTQRTCFLTLLEWLANDSAEAFLEQALFCKQLQNDPNATASAMSLFGWTIWIFSQVIKFTTSITSRFATVTLLVVPVFCFRKIDSKRCPLHLLNL